jgi:hypothetical protein
MKTKKKWVGIALVGTLFLGACGAEDDWADESDADVEDISTAEVKAALSTSYPDGLNYCGDGTLGTVKGSLYRKASGVYTKIATCSYGCAVNQAGVSDECLTAGPWLSDAITSVALGSAGNAKASLATATPAATWLNDASPDPGVSGSEGLNIREATTLYRTWRLANPSAGNGAPPSASVRTSMIAKVARNCSSTASQGLLVDRIVARYTGTVPTTDQGVLDLLGVRAQCKETVDRMVRQAGLTSQSYSTYVANGWVKKYSAIRAGNLAIMNDTAHIAVVVGVTRDSVGNLVSLTLAESNWASAFSCPSGQVPWERTVTTSRTISRSQINVGSGGAYKIVEVKN